MATKKEKLIASIKELNDTIYTDEFMSVKELQAIYDKLHVHSTPETEPDVDPAPETPEPEQPDLSEPDSAETPEPEPDNTEQSELDELAKKIAAAEPPEAKQTKTKPPFEKTTRRKKKGESSPDSIRIEGYILVLVTDTVFPFGFAALNNMLDKKIKVNASDLILTEKQAKELEYLADQAADYMQVNINPIAGFFIAASFMYGNNLLAIRMNFEKSKV